MLISDFLLSFQNLRISTTLPETNISHLKMDGWNTRPSFWGPAYSWRAFAVSFKDGIVP